MKCYYPKSYSCLCKRSRFRNAHKSNLAMIEKLAWRFLTELKALSVSQLKLK